MNTPSWGKYLFAFAAMCWCGVLSASTGEAAPGIPHDFDSKGEKVFTRYDETPLSAMTGTDGTRNLNSFYELRQYPGSPPRIPHEVAPSFSEEAVDCLSCHGKGGYVSKFEAFAPVTPHPENEACYQCHLPKNTDELFQQTDWKSIDPPPIGRPQLGGSPPQIPHSLQLREDCIACHTGSAAVAEIRVEHGARGNCRQCHVPMVYTEPVLEFTRSK